MAGRRAATRSEHCACISDSGFGFRRCFAFLAFAVLIGIGAPPVHAQSTWSGTVEVSPSSLTVKAGESVTYRVRLTEPPTADGWWVSVHVDGAVWGDGRVQGPELGAVGRMEVRLRTTGTCGEA